MPFTIVSVSCLYWDNCWNLHCLKIWRPDRVARPIVEDESGHMCHSNHFLEKNIEVTDYYSQEDLEDSAFRIDRL